MSLTTSWTAQDFNSWVIHDEPDWLAVNKPAGVPTAPSQHHPQDLGRWIKTIFPEGALAHRLDRLTSGVLIITKNKASQREWSRLFEAGHVRKTYLALVFGRTRDKGFIEIKIDPQLAHGKVKINRGKFAKTVYELVGYEDTRDNSLVLGQPITGRTHQIRAHFWAINHALVGDNVYRSKTAKPNWAQGLDGPWLHAYNLKTRYKDKDVNLVAPVPARLQEFLSEKQLSVLNKLSEKYEGKAAGK